MKKKSSNSKPNFFENLAAKATIVTGSTAAIIIAFSLIIIWGVTGPVFNYSETWQLVINTGTTIITFLMVFLIQKSQNKESLAVQLKLDELIAAHELASNRLVDVENMSEDELKVLQKFYSGLKLKTGKEGSIRKSHSIDEEEQEQEVKKIQKKIINNKNKTNGKSV